LDTVFLFALPLVGGFYFCSNWNFTRWRISREEGHRLYFRAIFFGALIFSLVALTHPLVQKIAPPYAGAVETVKDFARPLAKEGAAAEAFADLTVICFISMLAGWPLAWLLNLVFWRRYWLRRAILKDDVEAFLLDAAERDNSIAVTMDDQKVYVGFVVEGFDPTIGRKCIELLPLMSGYRDPETRVVRFTTFYTELYGPDESMDQSAPLPPPLEALTPEDFITLLPVDRIASYRLFHPSAYVEFQKLGPVLAQPGALAQEELPQS
jgi:hypothetical protein